MLPLFLPFLTKNPHKDASDSQRLPSQRPEDAKSYHPLVNLVMCIVMVYFLFGINMAVMYSEVLYRSHFTKTTLAVCSIAVQRQ